MVLWLTILEHFCPTGSLYVRLSARLIYNEGNRNMFSVRGDVFTIKRKSYVGNGVIIFVRSFYNVVNF